MVDRVLGIDPSITSLGYAVANVDRGVVNVVAGGIVTTKTSPKKRRLFQGDDDVRRILEIIDHLDEVAMKWKPRAVAIEMPGGSKSARAARTFGLMVGLLATYFARVHPMPVAWFQPRDVKEAVTGKRGGSKEEVARCVMERWPGVAWPLDTKARPIDDATDAAGILVALEKSGRLVNVSGGLAW